MKVRAVVVAALLVASLAACGATTGSRRIRRRGRRPRPARPRVTRPRRGRRSPRGSRGSADVRSSARAPPPWLGKRVLPRTADGFGEVRRTPPELVQRRFTLPDQLPALPGKGFASRVTSPAPGKVIARSTWKPGCPVAATDLAWVRLAFWGFDGRRHTGELLVNRSVADEIVTVFRQLYDGAVPDRGDADHPARRAGRSTDRRRQQHRIVRLPADDGARRRTPSTPTDSPWT